MFQTCVPNQKIEKIEKQNKQTNKQTNIVTLLKLF